MGWPEECTLLLRAAAEQFDAFITVDQNLQYQQNLARLPIAVVVLAAPSNELHVLVPLMPQLEDALLKLQPRSLVRIGA